MIRQFLSAFGREKRTAVADLESPFIPINWNRARWPGSFVSAGAVLSKSAVAARCVAIRSEVGAQVPLGLSRRLPNGDRERVSPADHPLARVLADIANPLMTSFEMREFLIRSLDLHGNAYGRIERNGEGQVTAIWPLEPTRVQVERLENGRLRYRYSGNAGAVVLLQEEVLHIRASSEDGLLGRSPLAIARDAFLLGMDLSDAASANAANGFKPAGIVMHPGKLTSKAKDNIRDSLEKNFGGTANTGRPAVFEEGMKWQSLSWSPQDSALLESRAMSASDVCFAFNLSPAILGLNESVSYGSAAQAAQDLVTNALQPLCTRIEQAMQRCLLSERGRQTYIIEHELAGLLRSDPMTRWTSYEKGRNIGVYSVNEVRRFENLPAIEGGDDHTPLRSAPQQAEPPIASTK